MPVKSSFGGHIDIGGSCWIYNLDVDDGERAGSIQIGQNQIWSLEEEGTFALAKGRHLSMKPRILGYRADLTAFEDEAELVPNIVTTTLVTDSTMEAEPFTAAHEVTRIGSKGYSG